MTSETAAIEGASQPDDLFQRLNHLGIDYARHDHPPLFTVEDSKALRGDLPGGHCKNLFLRDKKSEMWLIVTLEDRRIDMKALGQLLGGARLSFGSADRLARVLGVIPGAVTPFALINDHEQTVKVILDRDMLELDPLNYHPLSNEITIAVSPTDLLTFIRDCGHEPEIMDLSGASGT
jgi:Ala-tRNA(Pro) deacylase